MPVLLERSRPTKDQQRAVHAYIRRQREKGKQALAESKAKEEEEKQRKKEEEKKKETVEDVKKEIAELESKLEQLKEKKHELFSQFKRALNYENEMKKQHENQALMKASTCITLPSNSRGVQGLVTGQVTLMPTVHPQSALGDAVPSSGVIRRQGSPPHPLSGFIQAQIHSQQMQTLGHVPYPPQTTQVPAQAAVPERFPGFQHSQVQPAVIAGNQPESHFPEKHHTCTPRQLTPTGTGSESQPQFNRQLLQQGGLPQQEKQQAFSSHQLQQQQQQQQQFPYHVQPQLQQQQQHPGYQQYTQQSNQKQAFQPPSHPQTQQQPSSAQHNQGPQHGYPAQQVQDQPHQSYPVHASSMHQVQSQQSYQVHSQQQGYQAKPQPVAYQPQQAPPSGQHGYHPQQQQQQQQAGQYPTTHGHQGQQHDQMPHRQQPMTTQQFHQQQGNQNQGRQVQYDSGHNSQQMPPPPQQQQQQQQQQKPEQRQGAGLGYSQHYTHDYQQHHAQGTQSVKRGSHKFSPYPPYSGSKSHHQGSTGKKYTGKYPSSVEGASSSGSYTGPSGGSSHSRHHHHQGRSHKTGAGYSSSSQQKTSRYYP